MTKGFQKIVNENIKLDRPANFFAEMFKSDATMTKIRSSLVSQQVRMKNFEEIKMRKQLKKIQKQRKSEKHLGKIAEKKKNTTAINKWKADLHAKGDKSKDLDKYIEGEHRPKGKKSEPKEFVSRGKKFDRKEGKDRFKNMKTKKITKGKRPGKATRMKKFNTKKSKK